jgi:hypothetical protein
VRAAVAAIYLLPLGFAFAFRGINARTSAASLRVSLLRSCMSFPARDALSFDGFRGEDAMDISLRLKNPFCGPIEGYRKRCSVISTKFGLQDGFRLVRDRPVAKGEAHGQRT